jgi:hypothetical protein
LGSFRDFAKPSREENLNDLAAVKAETEFNSPRDAVWKIYIENLPTYVKDYGLCDVILEAIESDDKFRESLLKKSKNR